MKRYCVEFTLTIKLRYDSHHPTPEDAAEWAKMTNPGNLDNDDAISIIEHHIDPSSVAVTEIASPAPTKSP